MKIFHNSFPSCAIKLGSDSAIKQIDFPQVRQATDYSCGAAALQVVLAYYGLDFREDELKEILKTNPESGTEQDRMTAFAERCKLHVDMRPMTIQDIVHYIDHNVPVILLLQAWAGRPVDYEDTEKQGHYATVIGYGQHGFFFQDPSMFERGYLSYRELMDRWHGDPGDPEHLGIAIYGRKPNFEDNEAKHMG